MAGLADILAQQIGVLGTFELPPNIRYHKTLPDCEKKIFWLLYITQNAASGRDFESMEPSTHLRSVFTCDKESDPIHEPLLALCRVTLDIPFPCTTYKVELKSTGLLYSVLCALC